MILKFIWINLKTNGTNLPIWNHWVFNVYYYPCVPVPDRSNLAVNLWHRAIFFGALPAIDFFYSHISRSFDVDRKKGKEANGQSLVQPAGPSLDCSIYLITRFEQTPSIALHCTAL
jgi:hypothetical protein